MRRLVLLVVLAFAAPAAFMVGVPSAAAAAQPAQQPEAQEPFRPSGFWTSPHPAKGGAYRYRMMGIGIGLLAITGYVMWRLVKKASAERARRIEK